MKEISILNRPYTWYKGWRRVLIHIVFWIFIFFFESVQTNLSFRKTDALFVVLTLREVIVIMIIHYALTYYAVPKLLFKGKWITFIFCILLFLLLMISSTYYTFYYLDKTNILPQSKNMMVQFFLKKDFINTLIDPIKIWNTFLLYYTLFFTILIKITKEFFTSNIQKLHLENENIKLEKENIKLELNFLKSQIHPHFFFNTLNNIYSLVTDKDEVAADIILRLSDLMRYSLYEANNDKISLKRELEFISDYVELERIRHKEHVSINLNIDGDAGDFEIPPLILVTFIENAFKHGINNSIEASWVNIEINVIDSELQFLIENSKPFRLQSECVDGGIGIMNVQRRLNLMYNNRYQLKIQNKPLEYIVKLNINMHEELKLQYSR